MNDIGFCPSGQCGQKSLRGNSGFWCNIRAKRRSARLLHGLQTTLLLLSRLLLLEFGRRVLLRHAGDLSLLARALPMTVAGVLGYGLLLALALFLVPAT